MSRIFLPKIHIDALLTAALRYAELPGHQALHPHGFVWYVPEPEQIVPSISSGIGRREVLSRENADEVGTMLWRLNFAVAEWDRDPSEMPPYAFEELPGTPHPLVVLTATSQYSSETYVDGLAEWFLSEQFAFLHYLEIAAVAQLSVIFDLPKVMITDLADFTRKP